MAAESDQHKLMYFGSVLDEFNLQSITCTKKRLILFLDDIFESSNNFVSYAASKALCHILQHKDQTKVDSDAICGAVMHRILRKLEGEMSWSVAHALNLITRVLSYPHRIKAQAVFLQCIVNHWEDLHLRIYDKANDKSEYNSLILYAFLRLWKKLLKLLWQNEEIFSDGGLNADSSLGIVTKSCQSLLSIPLMKHCKPFCQYKSLSVLCKTLPVDIVTSKRWQPMACLSDLSACILEPQTLKSLLELCHTHKSLAHTFVGDEVCALDCYNTSQRLLPESEQVDVYCEGTPVKKQKRNVQANSHLEIDVRGCQGVVLLVCKACAVCALHKDVDDWCNIVVGATVSTFRSVECLQSSSRLLLMFSDQDDRLVEALLSLLLAYQAVQTVVEEPSYRGSCGNSMTGGSQQSGDPSVQYLNLLDPHILWIHFLQDTGWDHNFLLDLLTGPETCFPTYFIKYHRYVTQNWNRFCAACHKMTLHSSDKNCESSSSSASWISFTSGMSSKLPLVQYSDSESESDIDNSEPLPQKGNVLEKVMSVHIRLRLAVERLNHNEIFPYKAKPLLDIMEMCEELYEKNG